MTEDEDTVETVVYQGQQAAKQLGEGLHRSSPVVLAWTTRSSARRAVEIKASHGRRGEGRKGSRERNRRFRSLPKSAPPERSGIDRNAVGFQNFKYVWVDLEHIINLVGDLTLTEPAA
jgi:hypothetical protein